MQAAQSAPIQSSPPTAPIRHSSTHSYYVRISNRSDGARPRQHSPRPDLAENHRTAHPLDRFGTVARPAALKNLPPSAGAPIPPARRGQKYIIGGDMHVQWSTNNRSLSRTIW